MRPFSTHLIIFETKQAQEYRDLYEMRTVARMLLGFLFPFAIQTAALMTENCVVSLFLKKVVHT